MTLNYNIHYEERCGRMLVAARDIAAGEIIFQDKPAAMGADNNPGPICLTCYKRLPGLVYRCRHCAWPLCGPHCQQDDGPHARECSMIRDTCPKFTITDFDKPYRWYNAIMALRVLWLKKNDPDTWKMLDILMDHRESTDTEDRMFDGVVDFIINVCKLKFSEHEIRHVLGVIDTNAYIIGENVSRDVDIQGLFPITSIINHACTANTICFATDGFRFTCRAVTDIKMGEELTTNYLHYHYHFYGLSYRSHELSQFWHFNCRCRRCRDMTEFGSLCDAVLCGDCEDGGCCPLNTSPGADWLCESCYSSQDAQDVQTKIFYWRDMLDRSVHADMKDLMSTIYQLSKVFHKNHYFMLETKRRVLELISEMDGLEEGKLCDGYTERAVEFARDMLRVQEKVAPGFSELRAYLSHHIALPLYWLTKSKYVAGDLTKEQLMNNMSEVVEHLEMVTNIWGKYRTRSQEWCASERARKLIVKIDQDHLHRNMI